MSGGHWNYKQYQIRQAVDDIDQMIRTNDDKTPNEWGNPTGYHFPPAVIEEFRRAMAVLQAAEIYWHRIDWLVSGDDGEESFLARIQKDLTAAGIERIEITTKEQTHED